MQEESSHCAEQLDCARCATANLLPIWLQATAKPLRIIALGASTGGPVALRKLLLQLPRNIPPLVVVQHMADSFIQRFAEHLGQALPLPVRMATDRALLEQGTVYLAPAGVHLTIFDAVDGLRARLVDLAAVQHFKPSIDVLFKSVAKVAGPYAAAALLTGIGEDGAEGLSELDTAGALTFAQDEQSAAVYGMPRAACALDAARHTGCPAEIGRNIAHAAMYAPKYYRDAHTASWPIVRAR
jgi:two-component system, chemotaxis family, protein-glutamate methylesterase/glutaminase